MNVAEAERNFTKLVERVHQEGISIDLERDNQVIARLTPPPVKKKGMTLGELNAFLQSLPSLGDDAEDFSKDIRAFRASLLPETDPWE